uniref:Putative secreted protein n=1 Tax=Ixodes scapularis TaxID=6945 RepID=A0A4D5RBU7_IXOSC
MPFLIQCVQLFLLFYHPHNSFYTDRRTRRCTRTRMQLRKVRYPHKLKWSESNCLNYICSPSYCSHIKVKQSTARFCLQLYMHSYTYYVPYAINEMFITQLMNRSVPTHNFL